MSTYNGEKYLREQMDSIFTQEKVDIHLLIRDDGSSDSTIEIINDYQQQHPASIDLVLGKNIGWKKSFFFLLELAHENYSYFDYFAFADQDDIWLPQKLNKGIKSLSTLPSGPKLYCSNLSCYKEGKNLGLLKGTGIKATFKNCIIRNYATGCTIIFNKQLLSLVCKALPSISIAHDYWCYLLATLCGSVYIDNESFILYRQHDLNQIGAKTSFVDIWKRRLHSIKALIGNHEKEMIAKELARLHSDSMQNPNAKEAVYKLASYRDSLRNHLSLLADTGYSYNQHSNDLWLRLRILFKKL